MNWDFIEGNWKELKGQIKERWGKLTDDDLDTIEGRRDQFIGVLQQRYGIERAEAEKQLEEYLEARRDREEIRARGR